MYINKIQITNEIKLQLIDEYRARGHQSYDKIILVFPSVRSNSCHVLQPNQSFGLATVSYCYGPIVAFVYSNCTVLWHDNRICNPVEKEWQPLLVL